MRKQCGKLAVAIVALLALTTVVQAAEPMPTVIAVEGLKCPNCAKKIVARLSEVPGVGKVQVSMEKSTITVQPKGLQMPSPAELWETVARLGVKPVTMKGPAGTFTSKPEM